MSFPALDHSTLAWRMRARLHRLYAKHGFRDHPSVLCANLLAVVLDAGIGLALYPVFFRTFLRAIRERRRKGAVRRLERNLDRLMRVFPPF